MGMRANFFLAAALALGAPATLAHAEDIATFSTEGAADAGAADPRTAALDEAFLRAVTLALADVTDAPTRKTFQAPLDQHVLQRARLWIANFKVTSDTTKDGRRELAVLVRVDRDKLRARLGELAIPTAAAAPAAPRSTVVLLRVAAPAGPRATFGAGATQDVPGLGALAGALRGAGYSVKKAPAVGGPARADGELPLSDAEADALAADAKAEQFAIAGVSVGAPVALRGLPDAGVLVGATVRVVQRRGGEVLGQGTVRVAARGADAAVVDAAIERALVAAASDALPVAPAALAPSEGYQGSDALVGAAGVVLVRLPPQTPWVTVAAQQKYLAGAKGVSRVSLRRMSLGGWVLGVETAESPDRVAQLAKKGSAKVRVVDGIVELTPGGAP